jgi:signal transduction histidine kinase
MEHMSIRELLTDESHEDGLALFENILLKGAITSDLWLKKKNGSKYCITLAAVRLSQKRFLGFAKDITQRKLAEESLIKAKEHAEESDRLKSAFLANMSHEIRTPLNAIVGFSSFFSDPDLRDEDKAKYAEIIKSHSYELLDIINNVLDMARIESGNANVVKRQVMLNDILDKMEQNFRLKLSQNKNANLQLICEKPLPFDQSGLITDADIVKKIFFKPDRQRA